MGSGSHPTPAPEMTQPPSSSISWEPMGKCLSIGLCITHPGCLHLSSAGPEATPGWTTWSLSHHFAACLSHHPESPLLTPFWPGPVKPHFLVCPFPGVPSSASPQKRTWQVSWVSPDCELRREGPWAQGLKAQGFRTLALQALLENN